MISMKFIIDVHSCVLLQTFAPRDCVSRRRNKSFLSLSLFTTDCCQSKIGEGRESTRFTKVQSIVILVLSNHNINLTSFFMISYLLTFNSLRS